MAKSSSVDKDLRMMLYNSRQDMVARKTYILGRACVPAMDEAGSLTLVYLVLNVHTRSFPKVRTKDLKRPCDWHNAIWVPTSCAIPIHDTAAEEDDDVETTAHQWDFQAIHDEQEQLDPGAEDSWMTLANFDKAAKRFTDLPPATADLESYRSASLAYPLVLTEPQAEEHVELYRRRLLMALGNPSAPPSVQAAQQLEERQLKTSKNNASVEEVGDDDIVDVLAQDQVLISAIAMQRDGDVYNNWYFIDSTWVPAIEVEEQHMIGFSVQAVHSSIPHITVIDDRCFASTIPGGSELSTARIVKEFTKKASGVARAAIPKTKSGAKPAQKNDRKARPTKTAYVAPLPKKTKGATAHKTKPASGAPKAVNRLAAEESGSESDSY